MVSATGPADPYLPGRLVRVRTTVAHRPLAVGVPLLAVAIAAAFGEGPAAGAGGGVAAVVQGAAQVAFIALQVLSLAHGRRVCLRCMTDAPLDPESAVAAARGRLRWFHHVFSTVGLSVGIFVPILLVAGGVLLHPVFGVLAMASFLPLAALSLTHLRLEPWCPHCRWDDDDDDEDPEPDPEPDPPGRAAPVGSVGPATIR